MSRLAFLLILAGVAQGGEWLTVVGADTVNVGRYHAWEQREAKYRVRNDGAKPVEIKSVHAACGCAAARCDRTVLAPGEHTAVHVRTLPGSIEGKYRKSLFIRGEEQNQDVVQLWLEGEAVPLVSVSPAKTIYAGRLAVGAGWSGDFQLRGMDNKLRLGDPVVETSLPSKTGFKSVEAPVTTHELSIVLRPTNTAGKWKYTAAVPVLSPSNHPPVIITVTARIGRELTVMPSIVQLPADDAPVSRRFLLCMAGPEGAELDVSGARWPARKGVTFHGVRRVAAARTAFTVRFDPEFIREVEKERRVALPIGMDGVAPGYIYCSIEAGE